MLLISFTESTSFVYMYLSKVKLGLSIALRIVLFSLFFSDCQYDFRSSRSTADPFIIATDRNAAFDNIKVI